MGPVSFAGTTWDIPVNFSTVLSPLAHACKKVEKSRKAERNEKRPIETKFVFFAATDYDVDLRQRKAYRTRPRLTDTDNAWRCFLLPIPIDLTSISHSSVSCFVSLRLRSQLTDRKGSKTACPPSNPASHIHTPTPTAGYPISNEFPQELLSNCGGIGYMLQHFALSDRNEHSRPPQDPLIFPSSQRKRPL